MQYDGNIAGSSNLQPRAGNSASRVHSTSFFKYKLIVIWFGVVSLFMFCCCCCCFYRYIYIRYVKQHRHDLKGSFWVSWSKRLFLGSKSFKTNKQTNKQTGSEICLNIQLPSIHFNSFYHHPH